MASAHAGAYAFASLVGIRSQDPLEILKRVEKGLAFTALELSLIHI